VAKKNVANVVGGPSVSSRVTRSTEGTQQAQVDGTSTPSKKKPKKKTSPSPPRGAPCVILP
jgi:hypothetical protein